MLNGGTVTYDSINNNVESIGFEFEFPRFTIELKDENLDNALKEPHNKLRVYLPNNPEYQGIELHIGNDGPYMNDQYNLEFTVTFKKFNCESILKCYRIALELLRTYIHNKFYRKESDNDLYNVDKMMTIKKTGVIGCQPQCTIGVKYTNIKMMFIDMLSNSDDRMLILKEIGEYEEMFKSLIELSISSEIENTWIFLVSYYYFYVLEYYGEELLKDKMPFFLRHGLISIMPPSLKEKMEQIKLNNDSIDPSLLNFNNYLYYLFYTRNYNNKIVILQYNEFKNLILAPHESNFFEITSPINPDTILYFEYRSLHVDYDLLLFLSEIIEQSKLIAASAAPSPKQINPFAAILKPDPFQIAKSISEKMIDIIKFDSVKVNSDLQPSKRSSQISSAQLSEMVVAHQQDERPQLSEVVVAHQQDERPQLSEVVVAHQQDERPQQSQYDFDIIYDEINRDVIKLKHKTHIEESINKLNRPYTPNIEDGNDYLKKALIILNQSIEDRYVPAQHATPPGEEPAYAAAATSGGYLNNWFHHCY